MELKGVKYQFVNAPWLFNGSSGWVFISLPKKLASEIRKYFKMEEEGWGRLKVIAKIGNSEWRTAIWFDTKLNTYLLPLKSAIRKEESIEIENEVLITIWI